MIRIAFIVICHTCLEQVNRLIDKLLQFRYADVYVHIDLDNYAMSEKIIKSEKVHILSDDRSFHITWGGINIVKATLELIRATKQSNMPYDYIWLLSGQDYPIVPIKTIEQRIADKSALNYIDIISPGDKGYNWHKKLCEVAYPSWINVDCLWIKAAKRLYKLATGGYSHTFRLFIRKKPFDQPVFFGTQWWTLTKDTIYKILEYNDEHPEILKFYEKTIIPDESFFQTMYMIVSGSTLVNHSLTYSYIQNRKRHPITLQIDDYKRLKNAASEFCFARKLDNNSFLIIQELEKRAAKTDRKQADTHQNEEEREIHAKLFCPHERIL